MEKRGPTTLTFSFFHARFVRLYYASAPKETVFVIRLDLFPRRQLVLQGYTRDHQEDEDLTVFLAPSLAFLKNRRPMTGMHASTMRCGRIYTACTSCAPGLTLSLSFPLLSRLPVKFIRRDGTTAWFCPGGISNYDIGQALFSTR